MSLRSDARPRIQQLAPIEALPVELKRMILNNLFFRKDLHNLVQASSTFGVVYDVEPEQTAINIMFNQILQLGISPSNVDEDIYFESPSEMLKLSDALRVIYNVNHGHRLEHELDTSQFLNPEKGRLPGFVPSIHWWVKYLETFYPDGTKKINYYNL